MIARSKKNTFQQNVSLPLIYLLILLLAIVYLEINLMQVVGLFSGLRSDLYELVQSITWPVIFLVTGLAWWTNRHKGQAAALLLIPLAVAAVQSVLALGWLPISTTPALIVASLGSVLVSLGLVLSVAVVRGRGIQGSVEKGGEADGVRAFPTAYARLVLGTTLVVFAAMFTGALSKVGGTGNACAGWPLCDLTSTNPYVWIQLFHRGVSILAAVLVAWVALAAWRKFRTNVWVLVTATAVGILYAAQGLVGVLQVNPESAVYFTTLHSFTSIAIWGTLVLLLVQVGLLAKSEMTKGAEALPARQARDFVALTKPIVVLLLLFTTYGGMVVAAQAWPGWSLTLWTLIGGALAAGGSSAVNQYIDRDRDKLMIRTAKRPIAAGRLSPAEGLAFGVALCLVAFFVLASFVNLLAALLAVSGMFYYVVLYSIFLKHATVQNIVIGGGAGAIPPLVGWAAVTGNLTMAALTLFVVIFLWTPPHFWALAIVKRKDYERAAVPMLPVVRGEKETRWQIFVYTLFLVAFTLTLPLFGLGSTLYLVGAFLLGVWLIDTARRVWRGSGNKIAWKMYRYSSMYLAFIFLVLMIDSVV